MRKVLQEKLSEAGMSRLAEKEVSEDDIMSEVGSSADFINSLQSFIEDKIELTEEASTEDDSENLKKFIQTIPGITRRQLQVFMVLSLISHPIFLFCNLAPPPPPPPPPPAPPPRAVSLVCIHLSW